MKQNLLQIASSIVLRCGVVLALFGTPAFGAPRYVWQSSPNPALPHTTWATAARTIQDAVDAASPGDEIIVTNGVYATGGRPMYGSPLTNRVAVDRPVTVRSVNGPEVTIIQGRKDPITTNGDGAVRCVYLTDYAVLSGFTLTNGATRLGDHWGGGVFSETYDINDEFVTNSLVTNCIITGNSARNGGGAWSGTLRDCTLAENSAEVNGGGVAGSDDGGYCVLDHCTLISNVASNGGGAHYATLTSCVLTSNLAHYGGGANHATLNRCLVANNRAWRDGGGGHFGFLTNCTLSGNSANANGGGSSYGTLVNCTVTANMATNAGGGASGGSSILHYNCLFTSNTARFGGGVSGGTLQNCTLAGNQAVGSLAEGGGAWWSTLNNCIVFSNFAPIGSNYSGDSTLYYCCTTPLPTNGFGNITDAPRFVDLAGGNLRLQTYSSCIDDGHTAWVTDPTDLDGRPRFVGGGVDMGAYEYQGPGMGEFIAWLAQHGLPTDGSADHADSDGDRANNWQEWRCGTDPTNVLSVLRLLPPEPRGADLILRWQSVSNRIYSLERSTNLALSPPFQTLATSLLGQAGTTSFSATNAVGLMPCFYRVTIP
jgi:hypothetical protein